MRIYVRILTRTSSIPELYKYITLQRDDTTKKGIYYNSIPTRYIEPKFIRPPALSDSPETATENT
jgi:hypothetical protein